MAQGRFELPQIFFQFGDAGRKHPLGPLQRLPQAQQKIEAKRQQNAACAAKNKDPALPEQDSQEQDQHERASTQKKHCAERHQQNAQCAQLLFFNFVGKKSQPRLTGNVNDVIKLLAGFPTNQGN